MSTALIRTEDHVPRFCAVRSSSGMTALCATSL
jgi:hypothetical protein